MFEVGFSELLLIMGLALLVLGPEKLPKVVGEIGRWMGRARAMARQFREQLEDEAAESSRRRHASTSSSTPSSSTPPAATEEAPAAEAATAEVPATEVPATEAPAGEAPAEEPTAKAGPDSTP
ncbi:MAG: Sec-independent protein translocase protein TatB [Gammaproteobacteria bacterium]